jgi:Ni/Fe-hydrogenase subunit HybB-like protein
VAHDAHAEMPYKRLETVPQGLRGLVIGMTVIGAIAFIAAALTNPARAWRAYYFNWLFFMSIAQGAVLLSAVVTIAKGLWSRPLRRISLSFAAFMPIAYLMLIPILFNAGHIFPWIADPVPGKDVWLNMPFLSVRTLIGLGLLVVIDIMFAYYALRPDMGLIRERTPSPLRSFNDRFTGNWRGQEAEELNSFRKLTILSPVLAVTYALVMGMIAWDFVMSLEPHWFSTLIGPYFFMGAFLGGLMLTAITAIRYRKHLGLEQWITSTNLHDLGKLCFGFTVFWGYLFFGQFIVIWYGLLPIEQSFVIHRFSAPFVTIAYLVGLCIFLIPFFGLLGVFSKKTPALFTLFASISLLGLWLERWILTYPTFYLGADKLPFSWYEPGVFLLFAGLLISAHLWFTTRFPLFQMWVPATEVELRGIPMERAQVANIGT